MTTATVTHYKDLSPTLLAQGYEPIPINGKRPPIEAWNTVEVDDASVSDWSKKYPNCGVGIRTGQGMIEAAYAVDIDFLNPELSKTLRDEFVKTFGEAPERVGKAPKVLLLYRGMPGRSKIEGEKYYDSYCETNAKGKQLAQKIEILGDGQQFAAFSIHPDTKQPYSWGSSTPLDTSIYDLPELDLNKAQEWLNTRYLELIGKPAENRVQQSAPVISVSDYQHPLSDDDKATLRAALPFIRAQDIETNDEWSNNLGYPLKQVEALGFDEAYEWWHTISAKDVNGYDHAAADAWWYSHTPNGKKGIGSLLDLAKRGGYTRGATEPQPEYPDPVEIDLSTLATDEVSPPKFVLSPYIPEREVTSLYANGGTGKTILALNLAVCMAVGQPFLEFECERSKVLFYSAEDDEEAIKTHLQKITAGFSAEQHKLLVANLRVLDATKSDPVLFTERNSGGIKHGEVTNRYTWLRDNVQSFKPRLLVVDNISDIYAGGESDRPQVRSFIRAMRKIVAEHNGAVMLIGHVDKNTAKGEGSTQSYSGSTAWNNSVRSRLFLSENEAGSLVLQHQKSNRCKRYHDVTFRFENLVPTDIGNLTNPDPSEHRVATLLGFMKQLQASGVKIPANLGAGTNAYGVVSKASGFPKDISKGEFLRIVAFAKSRELIVVDTVSDEKGRKKEYLTVVYVSASDGSEFF